MSIRVAAEELSHDETPDQFRIRLRAWLQSNIDEKEKRPIT